MRLIGFLVKVPLGFASYGFYLLVRTLLRALANRHVKRKADKELRWEVLDADWLSQKGAFEMMTVSAPRWNPHAVIGMLGPVNIDQEWTVNIQGIRESCEHGVVVVYRFPERVACDTVDVLECGGDREVQRSVPASGKYLFGLRYYGVKSSDAALPEIRLDQGENPVLPLPVSAQSNAFYETLANRGTGIQSLLHYHVLPFIEFRSLLGEAWVERVFLPVGNPETGFAYGRLLKGQTLSISLGADLWEEYRVMLTFYDRRSLPVKFVCLESSEHRVPVSTSGTYLIRFSRRRAGLPRKPSAERYQIAAA